MTILKPRYSKQEFARLGIVRSQVEPSNKGKIVAIDIETSAWEIDSNEIVACSRLRTKYPTAQIWIVRVGSTYVRRFGAGRIQKVNGDYELILCISIQSP
ncbi:MAG: hypothetical protein EAZ79_14370 [Oscillatoriales cyanobacterium]|nr:MAG: hypothetical protein EAZ79_14370 [Oscillatoriales cyanobacterium]